MTDHEELDEDLFADLYEGDDILTKSTQPAPAVRPEEPDPVKAEAADDFTADSVPYSANGAGSGALAIQEASGEGGDVDMNGSGWNGNAHQSYHHGSVDNDDNYGPINVKEDG